MTAQLSLLRAGAIAKWALGLLSLALALCFGCSSADPGEGADLWLGVEGAQLVRGTFPEDEGGPEVTFADFRRTSLKPGEGRVPLSGRTDGDAYSVRVGLRDDLGYWTIPVGAPDPAVQGELTWETFFDLSPSIDGAAVELLLQAVDERGRGGRVDSFVIPLESSLPQGALAVRLSWDASADVDLWITDPSGVTLSPKNISGISKSTPGPLDSESSDSDSFGFIDIDSNANCQIDGLRRETALWEESPAQGTYQVSVDLASPCATERTSFAVSVFVDGRLQTSATGNLFAFDARETASGSGSPIPVVKFTLKDGEISVVP